MVFRIVTIYRSKKNSLSKNLATNILNAFKVYKNMKTKFNKNFVFNFETFIYEVNKYKNNKIK